MRIIVLLLVGLLVLGSVGGVLLLSLTGGAESSFDGEIPVTLITIFITLIVVAILSIFKMRRAEIYSAQRSPAMIVAIILGVVLLAAGIVVFFLIGG